MFQSSLTAQILGSGAKNLETFILIASSMSRDRVLYPPDVASPGRSGGEVQDERRELSPGFISVFLPHQAAYAVSVVLTGFSGSQAERISGRHERLLIEGRANPLTWRMVSHPERKSLRWSWCANETRLFARSCPLSLTVVLACNTSDFVSGGSGGQQLYKTTKRWAQEGTPQALQSSASTHTHMHTHVSRTYRTVRCVRVRCSTAPL